jgi:uncharacterized protein (UPF0305 family)
MFDPIFFKKHIIVHTHIEKTGGSSTVNAFRFWFPGHIHDLRPDTAKHPELMNPREKVATWILSGHFHAGDMDRFFERKPLYICSVRDPVERFVSYVKFIQKNPTHPEYSFFQGKNIVDAAKLAIENQHHSISNVMVKTTKNAKYNVICPIHRIDDFIEKLAHAFDKPSKKFRRNVNDTYDRSIKNNISDILKYYYKEDSDLYDQACNEFDTWLSQGSSLEDLFNED